MGVSRRLEEYGGSMSFKFKLGEVIVPSLAREMGIPVGPSKVTAIQLDGYVQIEPMGTGEHRRHLVEAKYYERFEEEVEPSNNQDTEAPSGGRT